MNQIARSPDSQAFAVLRRFARSRAPAERCELCGAGLAHEHRHLLRMEDRQIACACDPCALRFSDVVEGRFKLIPRDSFLLSDFQIDDVEWEDLALPINLVFFVHDSAKEKVVALYPGPAGTTESLLRLEMWQRLVERNPILSRMQPDVEALLVNRVGAAREYFLVPIDLCYSLVGLIRLHWRGFSGGTEAWREIGVFFTQLRSTARTEEVSHA
jgi:hypothetical protein